jgi:hypothetical protein
MLRLAKAFWDIALWRRSPAYLPSSLFLLGLAAAAVALLEVLGGLLPHGPSDPIFTRVVLSVGLPLLFAWVVLAITRHRQRFLQTGSALLGVAVFAELVLYPLDSLLSIVGSDKPAAIPIELLWIAGVIWYVLACANIWRAALDSGLGVGLAVSVGYLLLSTVLDA